LIEFAEGRHGKFSPLTFWIADLKRLMDNVERAIRDLLALWDRLQQRMEGIPVVCPLSGAGT